MEKEAVKDLYERYGYAVWRRCLHLLGSPADADEALQDVFMRVMRYGKSFNGASALGWLYRISDRHCFDVLKIRKRHDGPEPTEQILEAKESRRSLSPAMERIHLVAQVLAACPKRIQRVAVLYYVDEMTQDEVAQAVGCSRKTVKKRLAQFRDIGSKLLCEDAQEGGRP